MSYWITGIALVASLAGTAVTVQGQRQQAKAAEDTADYNAKLATMEADKANQVNAENLRRKQEENRKILASVNAGLSNQGFTFEGSALAVFGETASLLERDILDMNFQGNEQRRSLITSAQQARFQGQQTSAALRTSQYATVLGGASQAAGGYLSATGTA